MASLVRNIPPPIDGGWPPGSQLSLQFFVARVSSPHNPAPCPFVNEQSHDAIGKLTKIFCQLLAAGPAAYTFFSRTMMNLREKDDAWAAAFGGFMGGGVLGLPCEFFFGSPLFLRLSRPLTAIRR